jgi:hypothetical protein
MNQSASSDQEISGPAYLQLVFLGALMCDAVIKFRGVNAAERPEQEISGPTYPRRVVIGALIGIPAAFVAALAYVRPVAGTVPMTASPVVPVLTWGTNARPTTDPWRSVVIEGHE